ncbi:hypothetical protein JXA84_01565 [candidate division WOR-3 bacterium]|nr:hypothetical protein [candidate division WOR-3 bacterium]
MAAFVVGLFSGKFMLQKNKLPDETNDTIHSLLLRITVLEDSLDNSLWHLNDISKFKDSVLFEGTFEDTLE